ncbi:MAG: hypothetical protein D6776_03775, partial [Planctomycetota bacterium]
MGNEKNWLGVQLVKADGRHTTLTLSDYFLVAYRSEAGSDAADGITERKPKLGERYIADHQGGWVRLRLMVPNASAKLFEAGVSYKDLPKEAGGWQRRHTVVDNLRPLLFRAWRYSSDTAPAQVYAGFAAARDPELASTHPDDEVRDHRHAVVCVWEGEVSGLEEAVATYKDEVGQKLATLLAETDTITDPATTRTLWSSVVQKRAFPRVNREKHVANGAVMVGKRCVRPGLQAEAALHVALLEARRILAAFPRHVDHPLVKRSLRSIRVTHRIGNPAVIEVLMDPDASIERIRKVLEAAGYKVPPLPPVLAKLNALRQKLVAQRADELFEQFFEGRVEEPMRRGGTIDLTPRSTMLAVGGGSGTRGLNNELNWGVGLFAYNYAETRSCTKKFPMIRAGGSCVTTLHISALGLDFRSETRVWTLGRVRTSHPHHIHSGWGRVYVRSEIPPELVQSCRITIRAGSSVWRLEAVLVADAWEEPSAEVKAAAGDKFIALCDKVRGQLDRRGRIKVAPLAGPDGHGTRKEINRRTHDGRFYFEDGSFIEPLYGDFTFARDCKASSFSVTVEAAERSDIQNADPYDEAMVALCAVRGYPPFGLLGLFHPDHFQPKNDPKVQAL